MNLTGLIDIKEKLAIGRPLTVEQRDFVVDCINRAQACATPDDGVAVSNPPNYLGRIDNIWAFLSLDDGGEGLCAAPFAGGFTLPLIAADKRRLTQLTPIARALATKFGKPVRLAKFTKREDVEIIQP